MKLGILIVAAAGLAASAAVAQPAKPQVAKVSIQAEEPDPAALLNRAASLVEVGNYHQARAIYERVERMNIDYTLETSNGSWVYPAEIARRGMKEIEKRERAVILASRG